MSLHADWTLADLVTVTVAKPGETAADADRSGSRMHALVLTDGGNEVAFGIEGTLRDLRALSLRISAAMAELTRGENE
jgi:hypothetical protein